MKILVTGATGFIGHSLCEDLLRKGHSLVVLSRNTKKLSRTFTLPCDAFEWQPDQQIPPAQAFENVDAVIHLAGEPVANGRWTAERKKKIYDSRVLGTKNLVSGILKYGSPKLKTVISASAIGIYGDREDEVLNETSGPGQGFLADVCKDWEIALAGLTEKNIRTVNFRIGLVLGQTGGILEKTIPLFQAGLGSNLGNGKQWMSWIHLEDLIRLVHFCLEKPIQGPFNVTAPHPVTNDEFTETLAQSVQRSTFLPAPKLGLQAILGEMSQAILASAHVIPQKALNSGFEFRYSFLSDALEDLYELKGSQLFSSTHWLPKPIDEIFSFFADAHNLEKITPPWLSFHIVKMSTPQIQSGTLIDYKLKIKGVPVRWQSSIEQWNPPHSFVDRLKRRTKNDVTWFVP